MGIFAADDVRTWRLVLGMVAAVWVWGETAMFARAGGAECALIIDETTGKILIEAGACDQRFTPMSTFKVPLAVIGYDAGILKDAHSPQWDYRPEFKGDKRTHKATDPTSWQKESILWYSQEITRKLGREKFAGYVNALGYGNKDVAGLPGEDGLTSAWLMSSLEVSPAEQVKFIRRLVGGTLPFGKQAQNATRAIIPVFQTKGGWTVHGKTGSGWLRDAKGKVDRKRPLGWFVGWAENGDKRIVFARVRVGTKKASSPPGLALRDVFLEELPELMK